MPLFVMIGNEDFQSLQTLASTLLVSLQLVSL